MLCADKTAMSFLATTFFNIFEIKGSLDIGSVFWEEIDQG